MQNFFIFDEFYEDPYKVREHALNCEYNLTARKHWDTHSDDVLWPGRVAESFYKEKGIDVKFSKLLNTVVRTTKESGFFRVSPLNETTKYVVHIDGFNDKPARQFTAVVYLNTPDQCLDKKGTIFYRHKKTGKIKIDNSIDDMLLSSDYTSIDAWEIDQVIDLKFNRLVVLETNLFHSIGDCFGTVVSDSRLAQIFTLNEIT